jgi:hypothetical protein
MSSTVSAVDGVSAVAATLTGAVALGGAFMLIVAGVGHLWHPHTMPAALRAQRLLPARLSGPVAAVTVAAELLIGGSVAALALAAPSAAVAPLAAQSALYAAFAAFLWVVRRRRPGAPCGCFRPAEPVTWLVVARAAVLAGATAGALVPGAGLAALPASLRLPCLAGGFVVAMAGWLLPALVGPSALGRPGRAPSPVTRPSPPRPADPDGRPAARWAGRP